jgi:hypothetical protein
MKKTLLSITILALVGLILSSYKSQEDKDYSLATVYSIDGKYVFLYSQPYHKYDTVFSLSTMVLSNNPATATRAVVKRAFKEAEKRKVEFDGVITGPAQKDYVIKFRR